eukprot:TRINITY_DN19664_c0_g1_i1.p1 TRINITY_DN19664_c0_g1~~TRINITY_DN19664_c0_g1_i1.p1  ORF type:complete len:385 (+),score=77.30 TRINITY_DN19664_c0_g1_i1:244-1398(+)
MSIESIQAEFDGVLAEWSNIARASVAREDVCNQDAISVERLVARHPYEQIEREIQSRVAAMEEEQQNNTASAHGAQWPSNAIAQAADECGSELGVPMVKYSELHQQRERSGLQSCRSVKRQKSRATTEKTSLQEFVNPLNQQPKHPRGRLCTSCGRYCQAVHDLTTPLDECILSVSVYHPCQPKIEQQILVLGSQRLTDLKDKIYCLKDRVYRSLLNEGAAQSSFFFIQNTFYNDTRLPTAHKASSVILEWARSHWRTTDPPAVLEERVMEEAVMSELPVLPREQYLMCHMGNCEHLVVFDQVEMVHSEAVSSTGSFPVQVYQPPRKLRKCTICNIHVAVKETRSDELAPCDPCFFCNVCYRQLHYSEEGELLYNYTVYDYHHD